MSNVELIIDAIGASAAIIAAFALYLTRKSIQEEFKSRIFQTMNDIADELIEKEKSDELKNKDPQAIMEYCLRLNKIAFFDNNQIIPKGVAKYFEQSLKSGCDHLNDPNFQDIRRTGLRSLQDWCCNHKGSELPEMQDKRPKDQD
jgi:hypothetical protein